MASGRLDEGQLKALKKEVLYGQIHYLSEELGDPGRYFPFLKSKGVLDSEDCDRIRAKESGRTKVEEFVERLHKRQSSRGDPAFDVLVDALKKQKVQAHIARALQRAFAKRKAEEERRKSELWVHCRLVLTQSWRQSVVCRCRNETASGLPGNTTLIYW